VGFFLVVFFGSALFVDVLLGDGNKYVWLYQIALLSYAMALSGFFGFKLKGFLEVLHDMKNATKPSVPESEDHAEIWISRISLGLMRTSFYIFAVALLARIGLGLYRVGACVS
jgi:hypothetical protein